MPRIRSVHPEIVELEALTRVSAYADRTLTRLLTVCDDKGLAKDNPLLLKAQLYPLDQKMTPERVEKDLAELEANDLLHRYEVDGQRYLCVAEVVWGWQKPKHPTPSKLPPPPVSPSPTPALPQPYPGSPQGGGVGGERSRRQEGESEGEAPARPDEPQPVDKRGPWDPLEIQPLRPRAVTAAELEARAAAHAARERPA